MRRDAGFGLIEAVIAIAIVGMVALTVSDLVVGAAMQRGRAAARLERLLTARSLLAALPALPEPGRRSVTAADGSVWTVIVTASAESARLREVAVVPPADTVAILRALRLVEASP